MLGVNSCSAAVDTTFIQAVAGGIAGGAVSCGADCAGMAGASAITFFAIGQWANGVYGSDAAGQQATGRAIAHGVGGCVISTFEGGKCGQGAATAFLGKAITSRLDTTGYLELDIARAGVIGGTLSSIGGGKFANGAMMGAFQYLFNNCLANPGLCLNAATRIVQSAYGRLQILAGSPAGQLATQLAAAEVGVASPAAPKLYGKAVNSAIDLLEVVPDWSRVHSGNKDVQGFVWGNAQQIFSQLTKGAAEINPGVFRTADGFVLHMHSSSTNGVSSLTVKAPDLAGQFIVRIQQPSAVPLPSP
jgi:hypothetical protein